MFKLSFVILFLISTNFACSNGDPVATQYKNGNIQSKQNSAVLEPGTNDATPTGTETDDIEDDTDNVEDDAVAEETPEQKAAREAAAAETARLALVAQGKQVYETMCMGCHMAPTASTLNGRDPAVVAAQNNITPHQGTVAVFPNLQVADAVVKFLKDVNNEVAAALN